MAGMECHEVRVSVYHHFTATPHVLAANKAGVPGTLLRCLAEGGRVW
jgi:hypothetical protein